MDLSQKATQSAALMPEQCYQRQSGPTAFVMSNTPGQRAGFRESSNAISAKTVGFAEIDLPFLLGRPHQIKTTQWTTTQEVGTDLFTITSDDMRKVSTLDSIMAFQYLYRWDPIIEVTISTSATAVGALLVYWKPFDVDTTEKDAKFETDNLLMFPHEILQPYKQASVNVRGYFQKAQRFQSFDLGNIGQFVVTVFNKLGGASATPASNVISVTAYVNFENISTRVPKAKPKPPSPPPGVESMSEVERLKMYERLKSEFEKDLVVRKGDLDADASASDSVEQVIAQPVVFSAIDTVAEKATEHAQAPTHGSVGGHSTQYRGFLTTSCDNMKLSLQRFGELCVIPAVGNKFPPNLAGELIFEMTLDDMVRCFQPALFYYCYSGGVRLKWVTTGSVSQSAILRVVTLGSVQCFNVWSNPEVTIGIPYYSIFSAKYLWSKDYTALGDKEQFVQIYLSGSVTASFTMLLCLATADDFVLQHPMPHSNRLARWSKKPVIYKGQPQVSEFERKGIVDDVEKAVGTVGEVVGGVAQAIGGAIGVVDTVAGFVADAGKVLGLFDKPDAPSVNEWSVVDHAVPVVRMQYSSTDYVAADLTVSCDKRGVSMMQISKLLEIPLRIKTVQWTSADVHGKSLTSHLARPLTWGLWDMIKDWCPMLWRGTCKFRFEFVKNVFHKGVVVAIMSREEGPITDNYTDYQNLVFDISNGDSFEFVIPYIGLTDYMSTDRLSGSVELIVINALVAQSTTTEIDINVYFSMEDVELRIPPLASDYLARVTDTASLPGPFFVPEVKKKLTVDLGIKKRTPVKLPSGKPGDKSPAIVPGGQPFTDELGEDEVFERKGSFEDLTKKAFLVINCEKNSTRHSESDHDFLTSCCMRNMVDGDLPEPIVDLRQSKGLIVCAKQQDHYEIHFHSVHTCGRYRAPLTFTPEMIEVSVRELIKHEWKIPLVRVPVQKRPSRVDVPMRFYRDGPKRYVVIKKDGQLVRALVAPNNCWDVIHSVLTQDFPFERKGALATKMGEGIGTGVSRVVSNKGIHAKLESVRQSVVSSMDSCDQEVLGTLLAAASLKVPAYLFQAASVSDCKSVVSLILHLLGDAVVALRGYKMIVKLIEGLCDKIHSIVSILVDPTPKGSNDEEDRSLWKIVKKVVTPIVGKAWATFASFAQHMKPFSLLGGAARGITAIIDFFKGLLNWFGLCFTAKRKHLEATKKWMEDNAEAIDKDLRQMKSFIITGNLHAVATDPPAFAKLKALAARALEYKERLGGIWSEPNARPNCATIDSFLKKVLQLPNDPLGACGFEPVFVLLEGEPGLGKSIFSKKLAAMFATVLTGDPNAVYRVDVAADYWTGCADQQVYLIDDLFQDAKGEGVSRLTQLISTVGCSVPKADIEGKFGMSQARVVIGSSNSARPTVGALTCPEALVRRYKETHFTINKKKEWTRVLHRESGTPDYSDVMSEEDIADFLQRHFAEKWERHLELLTLPSLHVNSRLSELMASEREHAIRMHREQVGTAIIEDDDSSSTSSLSWDSEAEDPDKVVRKGKVKPLFGDKPEEWSSFYKELCRIEDDGLLDYLEKFYPLERGATETLWGLRLRALNVPYSVEMVRVAGSETLVFAGLGSDFNGWKLSADMNDKRNRFCVAVAYWAIRDVESVAEQLRKNSHKTISSRVLEWIDSISYTLAMVSSAATCLCALGLITASIVAVYYGSRDPERHGAYDTRPYGREQSKVVRPMTRKGRLETRPYIEKSILGWTCTNSRNQRINVHCLSVGQGYVLVNSHGIIIGMQHSITYMEGDYKRVVPVHVSEKTVVEFTCGEESVLDLSLVWIGSTIPLRKGILNYFVSQAQVESLTEVDAVAMFERGNKFVDLHGRVTWTDRQRISRTSLGEEIYQRCYVGPIHLEDGDCGSPLIVNGGANDGKILGIASAGSVTKGVFLPVTKEAIKEAMSVLAESVGDTLLPLEDSALIERCGRIASSECVKTDIFRSERGSPSIPLINPQFLPLYYCTADECSSVAMKTKLVSVMKWPCDDFELDVPKKGISITSMCNSPEKIYFADGRRGDGQIFSNQVSNADFDSLRLEMAVEATIRTYRQFIGPCKVYTMSEVLNRIDKVDVEFDIALTSNPVNSASASGHTLDYKYGKQSRGKWLVTDENDVRRLGPEIEKEVFDLEQSLRSGKFPKHIVEMHYKDELRPLKKVDAGKCRIFFVADFAVWILQKKYFGDFVTRFRGGHGLLGKHAIGCDPVKFWDSWAKVFNERPILCGDVSGWDSSVNGWHIELLRRVIEHFYPGASEEDKLVRKLLLDAIAWTQCVIGDANFMVEGLKSGLFATSEFNTVLHNITTNYCLYDLMPMDDIVGWPFLEYGDDSIISLPDNTPACLDAFVKGYADMGFKLTGQDKGAVKSVELRDAVFLKRGFYELSWTDYKFYVPRMDRSTIRSLIDFKRKGVEFIENVRNALVFARQGWDSDMFAWVNCMAHKHFGIKPKSWDEVGTWYEPHRDEVRVPSNTLWIPNMATWRAFKCRPRDFVQLRLAHHYLVPIDVMDICSLLEFGHFMAAIELCSETGLEFPVFTIMRNQLAEVGIVLVSDYGRLCAMWWFYCYYFEDPRWFLYVKERPRKLDEEDLLRQENILAKFPTCFRTEGSLRVRLEKLEEQFPCYDAIVWVAIWHILMSFDPDWDGSLIDVIGYFETYGLEPEFHKEMSADRIMDIHQYNPVRLPYQEAVLGEVEDPWDHHRMKGWMGLRAHDSTHPVRIPKGMEFTSRAECVARRYGGELPKIQYF